MPENTNAENPVFNQDAVIQAEHQYLNLSEENTGTGLAISGGGIRSASFGLGVMQSLVNNRQLSKMDYMSTVSGGGYLGSALTWALKQGGKDAGTDPENFPLGKRGKHREKDAVANIASADKGADSPSVDQDNNLLDFIRLHGSYLIPTSRLDIISVAAVIMRSMIMSLFVYFSFLTVVMTLAIWLLYDLTDKIYTAFNLNPNDSKSVMIVIGLAILTVMTILGLLFSLSTFFKSENFLTKRYSRFVKGQMSIGLMLKISLTCFVLGSLPYIATWIEEDLVNYVLPSGSTLFGTLVGLWQYKKAHNKEENSGIKSDLLIYSGAIALFYGVLLFSYLAATNFFLDKDNNMTMSEPGLFIIFIGVAILFGWMANLNLIGPHYLWRNRLMEAFMPNKEAVEKNAWEPSTEADMALMENMCDENNPRPYHIVNTNVILASSPMVGYSGRGGDNFILSRLYCGSDATGWKSTPNFQKNKTRGITLATAMATSAAALNPNAAVSGEGVTRNVVVSILLSMLNLRLGYWTSNPGKENVYSSPNFFIPGLTSEILRTGLSETKRNIQLSDGGHFENLAVYELIRRKLKLIIVSDGGADPNFNFDDLANVIEKVRVDFGVKIAFRKDYPIDDILPGTAGTSAFQQKYNIAKRGFAIADIKYNDGKTGVLVYIKLAMIEDLPTDVFSYKGIHPSFPHQSTADQFFDEKQFEAYRELGYYTGWKMMESEEGKKLFPGAQ